MCRANQDCYFFQSCNSNQGVCVATSKQCPNDCFHHGTCVFLSIRSGLPLPLDYCSVLNVDCEPVCNCFSGFFGSDCSYNGTSLVTKARVRESLLNGLWQLTDIQEANLQNLQSWMSSLRSLTSVTDELSLVAANITSELLFKLLDTASALSVSYDSLLPLFGVCNQVMAVLTSSGKEQ